ncbi:hypothetical protein [[Mycoplasma] collis]|uniref:hypothetical protein n=1 Tax=[Mycoplasma] collis TaxID=2127 RepID=UPI00051C095B|nr:hypothetical protein [[Mycoplasma] collis]
MIKTFLNKEKIKKLNSKSKNLINKLYEKWNITKKNIIRHYSAGNIDKKEKEFIDNKQMFISPKTIESIRNKNEFIITNKNDYIKYFPNYKFKNFQKNKNFFKTHNVIAFFIDEAERLFSFIDHIYPKKINNKIIIKRFNLKDVNMHIKLPTYVDSEYIFFFPYEKKYEIEFINDKLKTLESMEILFKISNENSDFNND